jgi:hypothetical protein
MDTEGLTTVAVFDTLKLARSLREAGMPGEQAEATAGALAEAFTGEIAEKRDIEALRRDIEAAAAAAKRDVEAAAAAAKRDLESAVDKLNARMTFLQWQLGLITALLLGVLLKLFLR